jgi:small subunit ribosomal protein S14
MHPPSQPACLGETTQAKQNRIEKSTMSTLGAVAKNKKRKALVDKYKAKREELRGMVKNEKLAPEVRDEAMRTLAELPRNSSATRIRNRCALTGRPRGFYRKFGLSRIALRDMALRGELPGVIKASW